jgi:hypothetical protein
MPGPKWRSATGGKSKSKSNLNWNRRVESFEDFGYHGLRPLLGPAIFEPRVELPENRFMGRGRDARVSPRHRRSGVRAVVEEKKLRGPWAWALRKGHVSFRAAKTWSPARASGRPMKSSGITGRPMCAAKCLSGKSALLLEGPIRVCSKAPFSISPCLHRGSKASSANRSQRPAIQLNSRQAVGFRFHKILPISIQRR